MEKKKYIREVSDDELPVTLRSKWVDRKALYEYLAPMIEDEIKTTLLSMAKPHSDLANTVSVRPTPHGLIIEMDEYGAVLDKGSRGRIMMGIVNKTIPIEDDGRTVFRKVSPSDISKGKWYHPGTYPTHFVEVSMERVISMAEGSTVQ